MDCKLNMILFNAYPLGGKRAQHTNCKSIFLKLNLFNNSKIQIFLFQKKYEIAYEGSS